MSKVCVSRVSSFEFRVRNSEIQIQNSSNRLTDFLLGPGDLGFGELGLAFGGSGGWILGLGLGVGVRARNSRLSPDRPWSLDFGLGTWDSTPTLDFGLKGQFGYWILVWTLF